MDNHTNSTSKAQQLTEQAIDEVLFAKLLDWQHDPRFEITFKHSEGAIWAPDTLNIPFGLFFDVYLALHNPNVESELIFSAMMFGLCVASVAEEDKADPDLNRIRVLRFFFHKLREQIFIADELWETKEDPLLSFSYHLLHDRQATPKQIAEFASRKLGRTVSTDTWLQRVRRWAERKKDRPIGLRKREKTSKSKGDVSK